MEKYLWTHNKIWVRPAGTDYSLTYDVESDCVRLFGWKGNSMIDLIHEA